MRVGTVCYATEQGLGYLAKDFYDHGVVTDPVVVLHPKRPSRHGEWYPDRPVIHPGTLFSTPVLAYLSACDVVLFFETPFDWQLIPFLREHGVKTALIPMYECMPAELPAKPDLVVNPSLLDQRYYPEGVYLPVPAPDGWFCRRRDRARVFVHNAGHGGLRGRNGTAEVLNAFEQYVRSPAKLIIRTQSGFSTGDYPPTNPNVEIRTGTFDRRTLYSEGDVFLFPEKFNGLSLPLQEAFAAGMCVMCGDRFPMNAWLPTPPMIQVKEYRRARVSPRCNEFDEAVYDPKEIARTVDDWYDRDVSLFSQEGGRWAEENSWGNLKPRYIDLLERLAGTTRPRSV